VANGQKKSQHLGINALKERADKLRAELASTADEIAEVNNERRKRQQEEALISIETKERQGRALIASGEKLLREAKDSRVEVEAMDLGLAGIAEARGALREAIDYWAAELAKVQDSRTRRKRSQLEQTLAKLERRATRRAAEPEPVAGVVPVIPTKGDYGTPVPEPEPAAKE
jgi:hypothetical protein